METHEKRKSYRVDVEDAWAECCSFQEAGRCRISNLSRGGALLFGGPSFPENTFLRVNLHLPTGQALPVDAVVCREIINGTPFLNGRAIEFGSLTGDEEDVLADVITDCVVKTLSPCVLVCTSRLGEGRALSRTLTSLGFTPILATTPLGTIGRLVLDNKRLRAVVLGMNLRGATTLDVAGFLADYRPSLRRILVGKPSWRTRCASERVVHHIVRKPWTEESMNEALRGLMPANS